MSNFNNLIDLVQIPGGSFLMGSPNGEGYDDEYPQHLVEVPSFQMGKYPVTQDQYEVVMATNPSYFKGGDLPVERVTWNDAIDFCKKLSQLTGRLFRLPSEAEWEYACRAGTTTPYFFGDELTQDQANFDSDSPVKVGSYPPNTSGLYDMHGNVWEWCQDVRHDNYEGAPTDSSAWMEGYSDYMLLRGGAWYHDPRDCRSARRSYGFPGIRYIDIGFRVVCSAPRLF
jgi:formylglycine-generating enzyme required for sulfatase activity